MPHIVDRESAYQNYKARKGSKDLLARLAKHCEPPAPAPLPRRIVQINIREHTCAKCSSFVEPARLPRPEDFVPKIGDIKQAAGRYFKLKIWQIESPRKTAPLVYARQVVMYLAHELTDRSYPEIGRYLGGRDHTTVIYGARKIETLSRRDWKVAYDVAHVERLI